MLYLKWIVQCVSKSIRSLQILFCERIIMSPMLSTSQIVIFKNNTNYDSCMLYSVRHFNDIISISSHNKPEISYWHSIVQMKNLKRGVQYDNLPKGAQRVSVRPEIQTQGSLALPFRNMHCHLANCRGGRERGRRCFQRTRKERKRNQKCPVCAWHAGWWWRQWDGSCSEGFKPRARQVREHLFCRELIS